MLPRLPGMALPHPQLIALYLIIAFTACAAGQHMHAGSQPVQGRVPADVAPPSQMASFARLVGGEWRVTMASGATYYHAWLWGPGKYSLRKFENAATQTNPWAGEVLYWHPGHKQVRMLSLHEDIPAVGRGVAEGTIKFEGDTADGVFDLYQPRGPRKIGSHWAFDGPDKYHDTLLEDTGAGLKEMNAWDFVRIKERSGARPPTPEEAPAKLPKHLKAFEPLLGHTWETRGEFKDGSARGIAFHLQTTYQWIPSLEVICARVMLPSNDAAPTHLFDAYFYQHVKTDDVYCLALSNSGGVYEGNVAVLDGQAVQLDLKGFEGDRVVPHVVRFDFEQDGTPRQSVWSVEGEKQTLLLDIHLKKAEPKNG